MDWKKYEKEIFEALKKNYPNSKITYNQKIVGRYSKVERQIDVLIEGYIAGKKISIVIDGKYYSKKVDVKHVESFSSMIEDIGAMHGILITSKGYSKAAINRAYDGPADIELDILSFEELKEFQAFRGIPYSGNHGAIIPAPFGWIIDGKKEDGIIARLYQRGKTFEEAVRNEEWIYVNIFSFNENIFTLDELIKFQEKETLDFNPSANFEYFDTINRADGKRTLIRKILYSETSIHEYTGFVELNEFCIFCVLFTPVELKDKNIRKLEYCIEKLIPVYLDFDEK
jgi:hypothetical protein